MATKDLIDRQTTLQAKKVRERTMIMKMTRPTPDSFQVSPGCAMQATLLQLLREFHYRYRDLTKQKDDTTKNVRHFLLINSITNWEGFENKKITILTQTRNLIRIIVKLQSCGPLVLSEI